jgi:DNA-binding Lrp family transcriptional regulator
MQATGVIRRVAAVPDHYRLGFRFNGMTVWDVSDDAIAELGEKVGCLPFVSHCYQRPRHLPYWSYNLFAMVHGVSRDEVEHKAAQIREVLGDACTGHTILYSSAILKKTGLRLKKQTDKQ